MPSRAESLRARVRVEGLLRGAALAALVVALAAAVWQRRDREDAAPVEHVELSGTVAARQRDSLAALLRAGRNLSWSGPVASVMAVAEAQREPSARWRVAAVGDAALALRDSLGAIDSLPSAGALTTEPTLGAVQVDEAGTIAEAPAPLPRAPRAVLVLGRAGWEPRFVITALEEAGWRVEARLDLGRGRDVRQGVARLDRARFDVAIVLDSASALRDGAMLRQFVAAGGGLILAGEAAGSEAAALRPLLPARATELEAAETRDFAGHEPTHALPLYALASLRDDAVLVEHREGTPAIVARRVGAGRVVQMGYAETWRWRMQGEDRSVEEHRAFWSRLAASVATGDPTPARTAGANASAAVSIAEPTAALRSAPRAALVQALGPERPAPRGVTPTRVDFPWWLAPIILLALMFEWTSRRRRGAP